MTTNEQRTYPDDEISLKELILKLREWYRYLLSKWKTIVLAGILGGVLGLTYAWLKKPVYTATTTFVLEDEKGGGGLSQYVGLAAMVGIDLGGSGGGVFKGDNIMELYKSRTMLQKTLLTEADFDGKKQLLIDRFVEFNKLRKGWDKKEELRNIQFTGDPAKFSIKQDSLVGEIVKSINKNYLTVNKPDKKLSIIRVEVKAKDELFAKQFTDKLVANVNNFYVQTKTKKAMENLAVLQHQTDSVRRELNSAIGGVAVSVDANPNANPARQVLRVPSQRHTVDVQANTAILEELVKNLELAKVSLRRETPLIQVVDKPVLPLDNDRLRKAMGIILGGFLFGFLVLCYFSAKLFFKNIFSE